MNMNMNMDMDMDTITFLKLLCTIEPMSSVFSSLNARWWGLLDSITATYLRW